METNPGLRRPGAFRQPASWECGAFRQPKFECGCCEMLVFRVCGARKNFSLYRNPDLDDRIYDCLLTTMAAVQAADARATFLFVRDLNDHHQEWLGSTTTNRHGVAALEFATVSSCNRLAQLRHVEELLTS